MSSYVPAPLRRLVARRAHHCCEYCLIHEDDTFFGCHIEHVISEKHGGATVASNLAFACSFCNTFKGSDIATILPGRSELVRLFNPRADRWKLHFTIVNGLLTIEGKTDIGRATAELLNFNTFDRIAERTALAAVGRYPSAGARLLMR